MINWEQLVMGYCERLAFTKLDKERKEVIIKSLDKLLHENNVLSDDIFLTGHYKPDSLISILLEEKDEYPIVQLHIDCKLDENGNRPKEFYNTLAIAEEKICKITGKINNLSVLLTLVLQ